MSTLDQFRSDPSLFRSLSLLFQKIPGSLNTPGTVAGTKQGVKQTNHHPNTHFETMVSVLKKH